MTISGRTDRAFIRGQASATLLPERTYAELLQLIERNLGPTPGGTIAHLMSGFGHLSVRMAKGWGGRIVAIEPEDRVRAESARRNPYSGVIYMSASGSRLPIQTNEASGIVAVWAGGRIRHLDDLALESARVLHKGSRIVFLESRGSSGLRSPVVPAGGAFEMLSSTFFSDVREVFLKHAFEERSAVSGSITIAEDEQQWQQLANSLAAFQLVPDPSAANPWPGFIKDFVEHIEVLCLEKNA